MTEKLPFLALWPCVDCGAVNDWCKEDCLSDDPLWPRDVAKDD